MNLLRARSALSRSKGAASTFACASLSSSMRARALFSVSSRSLILISFNGGIGATLPARISCVHRSSHWRHRSMARRHHQSMHEARMARDVGELVMRTVELRARKHGAAAVHPRNIHIRLLSGPPSHHGWKLMRYFFAAVIAVFVIAADFESSEIRSIWMEPSFVVAEAQSEPAATSNSHIPVPNDGWLQPSHFKRRWSVRFVRNDDSEFGTVSAWAEPSQGLEAANVVVAPYEQAAAADIAAHAAASVHDE